MWSIIPKSDNQPTTIQAKGDITATPSGTINQNLISGRATEQEASKQNASPATTLKAPVASIAALVKRTTGDGFPYEAAGSVQENEQVIVVNYLYSKECSSEAPGATFQQEWKTTFDLTAKTWTNQVKEVSKCSGNPNQEWTDYSRTPNPFTIESVGSETVIKGDTQDTDGSLLTKDAFIVRYTKPLHSPLNSDPASQAISKSESTTKVIQAGDGFANLRSQPTTEVDVVAKIPNGTPVVILNEQTNSSGQLWYQVEASGQVGWVYSDLLN
nr:SH3 domain-containing protein [Trichocoleus sp. FACHB-591]